MGKSQQDINIEINGEPWVLKRTKENLGLDTWAICIQEYRTILTDPELKGLEAVLTDFHEITHAVLPDIAEGAVLRLEDALGEYLKAVDILKKPWANQSNQRKTIG